MTTPWIVAVAVLWLFVLVIGVLVLGLLRRIGVALERIEASGFAPDIGGAGPGAQIPRFEVFDFDDSVFESAELLRESSVVVFMSSECGPCHQLAPAIAAVGTSGPREVPLVVILDESASDLRHALSESARTVYQRDREASRAFQNLATPQGFLVDSSGVVLDRRVVGSVSDLEALGWRAGREVAAAAHR